MGWIAATKDGKLLREEDTFINAEGNVEGVGRPVQAGEEGQLSFIGQQDFGHTVGVDLLNGVILYGWTDIGFDNQTVQLANVKLAIWICDDSNIIGEIKHLTQEYVDYIDENNMKLINPLDGTIVQVRNDILTPLTWRPIWFTRTTSGVPTKIIGAQTTLPVEYGSKNVKKLVLIFADGRLGID